jgi:L-fuconolactonase
MRIVDTHCHASLSWYVPVESLLAEMDRAGVEQAVLIQMNGQYNNQYQQDCLRRFPGRLASVVIVDIQDPGAVAELERLAANGAAGIRLRPTARSHGDDPLAIWRASERLDLAISCFGTAAEFAAPAFGDLVAAFPKLTIVIEHLGSLGHANHPPEELETVTQVMALARFSNVQMKLTGLGEIATRAMPVREPFPFLDPVPDLLERAFDAFGPHRLMWGSDFPPVASREGYANALRWTRDRFSHLAEDVQAVLFGDTARATFKLR